MKLTEIRISGYKSIDDLLFPIKKYGSSYTTILLGKNGTGKSNVLDAFSLLAQMNDGVKVNFAAIKKQIDPEPETVSVFYSIEPEDESYRDYISKNVDISEKVLEKMKVVRAVEEVWLQDGCEQYSREWNIELKPITLDGVYYKQKTVANNTANAKSILSIKTKDSLTDENVSAYTELSWDKFVELMQPFLEEYFDQNEIPVSVWHARNSDLIQDNISLKAFAEDPSMCPALKNMFALSGFVSKEQIQKKIQEIGNNSNLLRKLEKKLSNDSTNYINSKWKEHKVRIDVSITDQLNTHIKIQDQDNQYCYYDMSERSEGFKQFVSLLLSISAKNQSGAIKNNLIVIDEPEVHLHPSGVRYMLDELIKIGQNNYVFLATHSNFMVDNKTKERHFLLTKERGLTHAQQITSGDDLYSDEVLQLAFGINTIRDFLSPYKLLLEGGTDKALLSKALSQIDNNNLDIRIATGNGANIDKVASKLSFDDIYPIVVVDDDEAGKKFKDSILKIGGGFNKENVYTIRDISGSIIQNGTIEDALPSEYLMTQSNAILAKKENCLPEIELSTSKPFNEQLKTHIQANLSKDETLSKKQRKEKLNEIVDEIKIKISGDYNEKNIKEKAPLLYGIADEIVKKFRSTSNES